jgi:hypothetical protein
MYNPPSGAKPRNTAPRSEVRGASREVLRYLIAVATNFYWDGLPTSGVFDLLAYLLQEPFHINWVL